MSNIPANPSNSYGQNMNALNSVQKELDNQKVTQIFKDDTGTRRVLLGKGDDGFYGLKVSQTGEDVTTASLDNLVFSSNNNLFMIAVSGTATLTISDPLTSGGTQSTTVAHGLSVVPAFVAFLSGSGASYFSANTYYSLPQQVAVNTGTYEPGLLITASADATNLKFYATNYSSVNLNNIGTLTFRYYLLQETAN